MNENKSVGLAVASMVLGIIAFLLGCCFWYITIPCAVIAIILAIVSLAKKHGGKGMAITGLILGILSFISAVVVLITGSTLLALGDKDKEETSSVSSSVVEETSTEKKTEKFTEEKTEKATDKQTEKPTKEDKDKKSDESNILISSWELDKDYEGKEVVVIEYSWTNTGDEANNFAFSLIDKVYQNGIELDVAYGYFESDSTLKDVQPGATYNFRKAYVLQDMTTVNVIVSKIFSSKDVLNEKIDLGGGDGVVISTDDIGETTVKIVNYRLDKDYEGKDVLLVDYEFYNGEKDTISFSWDFSDKAFQNGVECDNIVIMSLDSDVDLGKGLNEVQPGATYTVTQAYLLTDKSDVDIEVKALKLFSNEKVYVKETISIE